MILFQFFLLSPHRHLLIQIENIVFLNIWMSNGFLKFVLKETFGLPCSRSRLEHVEKVSDSYLEVLLIYVAVYCLLVGIIVAHQGGEAVDHFLLR